MVASLYNKKYKLQNPAYCFAHFILGFTYITGKNLLWIIPFLFFLVGYLSLSFVLHHDEIEIPSVVGKQLNEAFTLLSNHQLTIRLLDHKEDADLPDSTVLSQIPAPGQRIKVRQTVFLALSKQPKPPIAPLFQGKQQHEIIQEARTANIRLKTYYLESNYPYESCIAQIPQAGDPIADKTMIIYLSKGNSTPIIWPNLIGKPINQVQEFLESHHITPHIQQHSPPQDGFLAENARVIDQRPLGGSIISLDQKHLPIVQLVIQ